MFIQRSDVIALNSVNDNVLAGNQFEFAPTRCIVEFGINQSATGLEIDILIGARSVITRMIPLIKTTAPIYPDDFPVKAAAMPGERIIIRARNTTGGNLTLLTTVKFNPR